MLALGILIVTEAQAMARMCLFSPVNGVVLFNGEPVAGAALTRSWFWHWKDRRGEDVTHTDAAGRFSFPAVYGSSLLGGILPHEPVIEQKIIIDHAGDSYRAWVYTKGLYSENGERNGMPIRLTCRLESEPSRKEGIFGICELS